MADLLRLDCSALSLAVDETSLPSTASEAAASRRTCKRNPSRSSLKFREAILLDQIDQLAQLIHVHRRTRSGVSAAGGDDLAGWTLRDSTSSCGSDCSLRLSDSLIFVGLASGNSETPQSDEPQKTRFAVADGPLGHMPTGLHRSEWEPVHCQVFSTSPLPLTDQASGIHFRNIFGRHRPPAAAATSGAGAASTFCCSLTGLQVAADLSLSRLLLFLDSR